MCVRCVCSILKRVRRFSTRTVVRDTFRDEPSWWFLEIGKWGGGGSPWTQPRTTVTNREYKQSTTGVWFGKWLALVRLRFWRFTLRFRANRFAGARMSRRKPESCKKNEIGSVATTTAGKKSVACPLPRFGPSRETPDVLFHFPV